MPSTPRSIDESPGSAIGCSRFHHMARADRRSFLRTGFLGFAGLSLGNLLRLQAKLSEQGARVPRENSVIILWMRGGPSQHETWDPKPEAPIEYRGDFGAISTEVPGIRICDLLPMSARIMDK